MKEQFKYRPWHRLFTTAMVNMTINCNLQCKYCFVEQENKYMSEETLYAVIDLLAKNYEEKNDILGNLLKNLNERCCIIFFGGEPLLCYDNIVKGVNYANKKYPNLFEFSITTNGLLLTKEKVDFLKENDFSIIVSIDGNKETQDFNRPCKNGESSFDKLINNIPYILQNFPNLLFRSTISREKCDQVFQDYLFAESLGYSNYYCTPDHLTLDWTPEEIEILNKELSKIFEYRTNQFLNNIVPMYFSTIINTYNEILIHDQAVIDGSIDKLTPNWEENCGIGLTHIGINWNGDIYACQEQVYKKINNNIFLIGNVFQNGIDKEKHLKLINDITSKNKITNINPEKCNNCLAKNICHLDNCISCHYYNNLYHDNSMIMSDIMCAWKEAMLKNCIVQMKILVDENNLLFQKTLITRSKQYKEIIDRESELNVN